MFKSLLIFVAVLCCCSVINAQNVFNPADPIVTYNGSAAAGSSTNPNLPPWYVMSKWVRTSKMSWSTTNFKCYIWNGMPFRLRFPKNYNPANATKYPVIIFLHGAGEVAPTNAYDNDNQLLWGAQLFEQRINNNEWNGFLLFPQEIKYSGWGESHFSVINGILDTLQKYNNSDPDRIITMGLSAGGYGALNYANLYPKRIATALPASPANFGNLYDSINHFLHIPVWMANGGTDGDPDPTTTQVLYSHFLNAGGNFYRTYFAKDGHNTWTDMWNMKNAAGAFIATTYWNSAHKAQPLVYYQNQQFCNSGPIAARMGITPGYNAYEWQQNGVTIAIATGNEYTATQVGQYRVRFQRNPGGAWSDWTPNPVVISSKTCTVDTLLSEHFTFDHVFNAATEYTAGNFSCQNGVMTSGTDLFTKDASGVQGNRFLVSYTNSGGSCIYDTADKVWGTFDPIAVLPNTNYEFNFYMGNQSSSGLARLAPTINGFALISGYVQPAGTGNASWKKYTYTWNSGSSTGAKLGIINRSAATNGNEFAIDEISFRLATTLRTLPVTWLQVAAKLVGKEVQVSWKVADEINVDNYTVERSVDGRSFTDVVMVNANTDNMSEKQYGATDRLWQKGNNYYRIRQTDKDGTNSYSKTVLVNVSETGETIIWPNPAAITVNVQNGQAILRLQCFNGSGQLVYDVKPSSGNQYAIPVQQWSPGIYYITITGSTQVVQARFIKQ